MTARPATGGRHAGPRRAAAMAAVAALALASGCAFTFGRVPASRPDVLVPCPLGSLVFDGAIATLLLGGTIVDVSDGLEHPGQLIVLPAVAAVGGLAVASLIHGARGRARCERWRAEALRGDPPPGT